MTAAAVAAAATAEEVDSATTFEAAFGGIFRCSLLFCVHYLFKHSSHSKKMFIYVQTNKKCHQQEPVITYIYHIL